MEFGISHLLPFAVFIIAGMINSEVSDGQKIIDQVLWQKGSGSYNNYRIPSVLVTKKGTILAFCEGREGGDSGDINILMKSSRDNGKTWSKEFVVWDDGQNTCGNPCSVEDMETGRIWLILTWNNGKDTESAIINKKSINTRLPYSCYSDDDGATWSKPVQMPSTCKDPSWGWYATGPGIGIQLRNGQYKGRLVIPCDNSYDDPDNKLKNIPSGYGYGSHVLLSDDHGKMWRMGRLIKPGCNECQVAELSDGRLLMNMRSYNSKYCRAVSISSDGGETWSEIQHDFQLVEPVCQASILDYGDYLGKMMHIFTNPAVTSDRTHMTIRASFDDCKSWSNSRLIYSGPSAYSCLAKLKNRNIAIFFECGKKSAYETLRFISFQPKELFQPGLLIPGE
jgi:sialidase-1